MNIYINDEITALICKKFDKEWMYPIDIRYGSASARSYRELAAIKLNSLPDFEANELIHQPYLKLFHKDPSMKGLESMDDDFIRLHFAKTCRAIVSAVQNHGHKCIDQLIQDTSADVCKIQNEYMKSDFMAEIAEKTFFVFSTIQGNAPVSSVFLRDCLGEVWTLDEIGWRGFDSGVNILKEHDSSIKEVEDQYKPMPYDEFCIAMELDNNEFTQNEYNTYVSESKDELSEIINELNAEYNYIKKLDPFARNKILSDGYFEFNMIQYDTEGVEFEILPYQWCCKFKNKNGELLSLVCGSAYKTREEGFPTARDMTGAADIYSGEELRFVTRYLSHLEDKYSEDDHDDFSDIINDTLFNGPVALIQHMQRDTKNESIKGCAFNSLQFALECILEHFEDTHLNAAVFIRPYQHIFDNVSVPDIIDKMKSDALSALHVRTEGFFETEFLNWVSFDIIPPQINN